MTQQNLEMSTDKGNIEGVKKADSTKRKIEYEYVPPDGGWGWLVLLGSALVSLLIPGTIKSFGILFVEFLEVFNASPVSASWIPALAYFLYCSLGPLASYLSTKYGYRTVTLLGGVFAATGMISSVFASNIAHLYICHGILLGTGAGLSFPPGVFIVTSYFVRLRGLANGIAVSGSALGSIILPPFLRFLLENYGYRGAVLIMGGLILNVLVGASLYDPVQQHLKKVPVNSTKKNGKNHVIYKRDKTKEIKNENSSTPEEKALIDKVIYESGETPIQENKVRLEFHPPSPEREYFSSANHPLLEEDVVLRNGVSHLSLNRPITNSESVQHISRKISTSSHRGKNTHVVGSTDQINRKTSMSRPVGGMSRKISVGSNLSSSSFRYISTPFHGSTLVGLNPELSSQLTMKTQDSKSSCFSNFCCCFSKTKESDVQSKTKDGVYYTLMRDPVFIIILISNASTAIGYTNFTILLPVHAVMLGYDKDKASYLLSVVATLDLVGRIGGSALSDWLTIDKKVYFVGGLLGSGISLMFLALMTSYGNMALFCAAYGLCSGTYAGITAIIMVDLLGEDRLASSYGVSLFINGILQLIGPPICGFAFQQINSYAPIIVTLGAVLIAGAAVWISYPFVRKSENNQSFA